MASVSTIAPNIQAPHGSPAWLHHMIASHKEYHSEVIELTPALAKELLSLNPDNRAVRKAKVIQYANDIKAGRWVMNAEPIILSVDGQLNDGQHRCLAVIDVNTSIKTAIAFGMERDSRLTLDQGGARGAGDFLGMEGIANAALVAAIARMAIAYEKSGGKNLSGAHAITSSEIRARVYADDKLGESATFGHTNGHYSRQFAAGSLIGFSHYVLSRVNQLEAEMFLSRVCRGDGLRLREPAHTLREKLIQGRAPRDRKIKLILQAWNFHRRNMKVSPSSMDSTLPFPVLL